jgi:hypothetical protein
VCVWGGGGRGGEQWLRNQTGVALALLCRKSQSNSDGASQRVQDQVQHEQP